MLSAPIPAFLAIKAAYTHAVVGRTRAGLPVIVEGMGGFKATMAKFRAGGVTNRQILHQFVFVMEWVTRRLDPAPYPGGKFVRIYDFKGISFSDVSDSEAVGLAKEMMSMLEHHYPERMAQALVVNTPGFFSVVWKVRGRMKGYYVLYSYLRSSSTACGEAFLPTPFFTPPP